jgi:hypothetical protein
MPGVEIIAKSIYALCKNSLRKSIEITKIHRAAMTGLARTARPGQQEQGSRDMKDNTG